jgi:hypothetical protein
MTWDFLTNHAFNALQPRGHGFFGAHRRTQRPQLVPRSLGM